MTDRSAGTRVGVAGLGMDPVLEFLRLLWNVEHGLQSASKMMEATLGITGPQRLVLRIVSEYPDVSAGELARVLHLHPSTITGILQRLVNRGLLRREPDPADSRRVRLRTRPAARPFLAPSAGTVESAVRRVLLRIPAPRVRHAQEVLTAIADALATGPHGLQRPSSRRSSAR